MAYATASDVTTRWGKSSDSIDAEITALIEVRLGDAERMIKRRFVAAKRDMAAEIDAGTLDVEDLKQVEADAVLRLARNPEGYQSETDGSYTYMLRQDISTGVLEVLPTEWAMLGFISSGMFVIIPTPVMPT